MLMASGVTVSGALALLPLKDALIVTMVELVTSLVETVKVAVFEPAGTVTLAGTVAALVFELLRVTTAPPANALALRVIVPVDVVLPSLPTIETGLKPTELTASGITVSVTGFELPL